MVFILLYHPSLYNECCFWLYAVSWHIVVFIKPFYSLDKFNPESSDTEKIMQEYLMDHIYLSTLDYPASLFL